MTRGVRRDPTVVARAIIDLLRDYPGGLTKRQIASELGLNMRQVERAKNLARKECRAITGQDDCPIFYDRSEGRYKIGTLATEQEWTLAVDRAFKAFSEMLDNFNNGTFDPGLVLYGPTSMRSLRKGIERTLEDLKEMREEITV